MTIPVVSGLQNLNRFGIGALPSDWRLLRRLVWLIGMASFVVGDLLTTSVGLGLPGVYEWHPLVSSLLGSWPWAMMIGLKLVVLSGCYLLWQLISDPARLGIPLGLASVGVAVTGWNLYILMRVGVS